MLLYGFYIRADTITRKSVQSYDYFSRYTNKCYDFYCKSGFVLSNNKCNFVQS